MGHDIRTRIRRNGSNVVMTGTALSILNPTQDSLVGFRYHFQKILLYKIWDTMFELRDE